MKKCPFCAEEIKDEAIKCRHCGELLNQENRNIKSNRFNSFAEFLKQKYPAYTVVSENNEKDYIILNKQVNNFNGIVFIILLLFWVLPGLIYALATLNGRKILSLTIHFDKNNNPVSVDNPNFAFLIKQYKELNNLN